MSTPGSEPLLSLAVLGESLAPTQPLLRRLCRRAWHREEMSVAYRHPALDRDHPLYLSLLPTWALVRTPDRLLSFMQMNQAANHLSDIAWHLHQTDAVLLVVRAAEPGTPRDLLVVAAYRGMDRVLVYLDVDGVSEDETDRVERELRLTLLLAGFPGDDVPFVRGNLRLCDDARPNEDGWRVMDELYAAIEHHLPTPRFDAEGPARFVTRAIGHPPDRNLRTVRGRLGRGSLQRGEDYHAYSGSRPWVVQLIRVERFGEALDRAEAGQNVEVLPVPEGTVRQDIIKVGTVIAAAGTVKLTKTFNARLTFFKPDEGGRSRYVMSGFAPTFLLPGVQRKAHIALLDRARAEPGETFPIRATLPDSSSVLVEPGDAFVCRHNGRLVGHGVVE